jgi:hypothetical protein
LVQETVAVFGAVAAARSTTPALPFDAEVVPCPETATAVPAAPKGLPTRAEFEPACGAEGASTEADAAPGAAAMAEADPDIEPEAVRPTPELSPPGALGAPGTADASPTGVTTATPVASAFSLSYGNRLPHPEATSSAVSIPTAMVTRRFGSFSTRSAFFPTDRSN